MGKCMKQQFNLGLSLALAALVSVVGITHPEPVFGQVAARPAEAVEVPPATLDAAAVGEADAARRFGRVARAAHALRTADEANAPREELLSLSDELGQAVVALGPIEYLFGAPGADKREALEDMPYEMRSLHGEGEREIVARMVAFRERANRLHGARIGNQPDAMLSAARVLAESIKDQEFNGRFKPLDPDSVRRVVTGKIDRAPAMTRNALDRLSTAPELSSAKMAATADVGAAATGDIGTRALSSNPAEVTPRIQALAEQLGRSPIRIHNWVHDNIRFTPTYGVLRGAEQTLIARQGNAYDTNALLAALLNASGYSTRYVYGTVQVPIAQMQNWLGNARTGDDALDLMLMGGIPAQYLTSGGRISAIRFEHLWLEVHVDFIPSRGVIERSPDTWVPLDGSFKQHTYGAPLSLLQATGWNPATALQRVVDNAVRGTDGSITGLDLNDYSTSLDAYLDRAVAHIDANAPDANVDDVFGAQAIIPLNDEVLAGTLPYRVIARGTAQDTLPDRLKNHIVVNRFDTRTDYALESPSMTARIPTHALGGHSIYVGYEAATQAQRDTLLDYAARNLASLSLSAFSVRPVLRVGEEIVGTGGYATMGTMQMWTAGIVDPHGRGSFGAEPHEYAAGSQISFTPNLGGVTREQLSEIIEPLPDTVTLPVAQGLHLAGMQYWFMSDMQGDLSAKGWGGSFLRRPSVGAFAIPLQVTYFFGIPRTGFFTGQSTDIKSDNIAIANSDPEKRRLMVVQYGAQASFNESLTWDLLLSGQPGYGMSATSMLLRANELRVPIHIITQDNLSSIMPKLQLSADAESEIAQSVSAGLVAIVPEREYQDTRQVGAGYVILDPDSGAGLYRIDGGLNGAITVGCIAKAVSLELLCRSKMMKILTRRIARWGTRMLAGLTVAAVLGPAALPAIAVVSAVLWTIEIIMTAIEVMNWVRMVMNGIENLTPEEMAELGIDALEAAVCNYSPPCFGGGGGGGFGGGGGMGVGNPIYIAKGIKIQDEIDFEGAGAFPLSFTRRYISNMPNGSPLGHKWTNRYFSRIRLAPDSRPADVPEAALAARGDGGLYQFVFRNGAYTAPPGLAERLERKTDLFGQTTGWTYANMDDELETYDDEGKLVRIRNRAGLEQSLAYNDLDQLIRIEDDAGRALTFEYDPVTGQVVRMRDPLNRAYLYEYSEYGSLTKVTYPGATTREYHYETPGRGSLLTGITDGRGIRYVTWKYDYQNRAIESVKAGGVESYRLNFSDMRTVVTDPYENTNTYSFRRVEDHLYLTAAEEPCANCGGASASSYEYDGYGYPRLIKDFRGNQTALTFNARGLPTQLTFGSGSGDAQTSSLQWHPTWRLMTQMSEPSASSGSLITSYVYNGQGLPETRTVTADGRTRTWTYDYNTRGQVTRIDGPRTDASDVQTFSYDAQGNLASTTDAVGLTTRYTEYDAVGKLVEMIDSNNTTTRFTYDDRDRVVAVAVTPSGASASEITAFAYDGAGQLRREQLPNGRAVNYVYDDAGRLRQISDDLGNRIVYTLNNAGDQIKEERFDPEDRLAELVEFAYDNLGRLRESKGAGVGEITRYGYDGSNNVTSIQEAGRAQAHVNQYDALDRLSLTIDPLNGRVAYRYDSQDNLREVTDPRGLRTAYAYNGFNELITLTSPDTGTAQYAYDPAGNMVRRTDARNVVSTYAYDASNRLLSAIYPDETLSYAYDEASGGAGRRGRLTSMGDGSGRTSYTYDAHGRMIAKTQQLGADTNATGRRTLGLAYTGDAVSAISMPSGATVSYRLGADGKPGEVHVNGQRVLEGVRYHPSTDIASWNTVAGRYQRTFDLNGRIESFSSGNSTADIEYDVAGRLTGLDDWTYGYDDLDRLTAAADGTMSLGWEYDASGNRLAERVDGVSSAYTIAGTSNRLMAVNGTAWDYDAAGNATSASGLTFVYSSRGRMIEARRGVARVAGYAYNAVGERVCVASAGGRCPTAGDNGIAYRQYMYDGEGHLLGEYDGNGSMLSEFVWIDDTPVAVLKPAASATTHGGLVVGDVAVYFVHPDHLDTPRVIVNADGDEVWSWRSTPFGDTAPNTDPSALGAFEYPLRLPGQIYDPATALHYNYFRDYDPEAGRYVESDPIGLDGGINTYGYVEADPLGSEDLFGLKRTPKKPPPHKNCRDFRSKDNCHVYEIWMGAKSLYKIGESCAGYTSAGLSKRCQRQANRLNANAGRNLYKCKIVYRGDSKGEVRDEEERRIKKARKCGCKLRGNKGNH